MYNDNRGAKMEKLKDKKVLVGIGIILVIIIAIIVYFAVTKDKDEEGIDTSKLNNEEVVKGQEEVTNLIKGYVDGISNIKEYARDNSKVEFSIKELKGIFNIDTSSFDKLKYHCNEDNTFIKYDDDYNNYTVILDCSDFYLE